MAIWLFKRHFTPASPLYKLYLDINACSHFTLWLTWGTLQSDNSSSCRMSFYTMINRHKKITLHSCNWLDSSSRITLVIVSLCSRLVKYVQFSPRSKNFPDSKQNAIRNYFADRLFAIDRIRFYSNRRCEFGMRSRKMKIETSSFCSNFEFRTSTRSKPMRKKMFGVFFKKFANDVINKTEKTKLRGVITFPTTDVQKKDDKAVVCDFEIAHRCDENKTKESISTTKRSTKLIR